MPSATPTATGQDPYRAMLRGGVLPALVVAPIALIVFTLVDGALGAAGSALATAVVLGTVASTLLLLRRTAGLDPRIVFMVAMVGYMSKVLILLVFLLLFRNAEWLSPIAFAVTAIVVSVVSTAGEIRAFTRTRTLIYDEPTTPAPR